jgi:hypothetical protein
VKRCLDKSLTERLIDYLVLSNSRGKDEELESIVESCKSWQDQVVIINYLVTQIIQKKIKKRKLPDTFANELYKLLELGDVFFEEIDLDFIEFIFTHVRYSKEINENVFKLKERHLDHDYRYKIRY